MTDEQENELRRFLEWRDKINRQNRESRCPYTEYDGINHFNDLYEWCECATLAEQLAKENKQLRNSSAR